VSVIALDAVGIAAPGGGRSATLNLLRELLRRDTDHRYLLLLDRAEPELALGEQVAQVLMPVHNRFLTRIWGQVNWPLSLRSAGVQLVHHLKNLSTPGLPGRSIVTVYDLTTVLHPALYSRADVWYWRHLQPRALRRADCIIAISHTTARDLQRLYDLPANVIRVIYPACDPRFRPLPREVSDETRGRYGLTRPYLLHVGSISQKKNLLALLLAWEQLCAAGYDGDLALVGRRYGQGADAALDAQLARTPRRQRVRLTGPVPDEDLPALYNGADAAVFPSLHEGFGIVPVEAMACGVPLICSSGGALPEVVGDGGLVLEDASDPAAIAAAVTDVLSDEALRAQLVARGLARAALYTPARAASATLALYQELL
jgi:glycosyltransferase involved in cell wall biosynthesis